MQSRPDGFSAMGWAALHERLAELRAELGDVRQDVRPDIARYRELRRLKAGCVAAIRAYHQRPIKNGDTPPNGDTPNGDTPALFPPRPLGPGG